MKKSEMIKKIAQYLDRSKTQVYMNGNVGHAKVLVDKLTEWGMGIPYHSTKGYEAAESHGTGTTTYYRKRIREWDDE